MKVRHWITFLAIPLLGFTASIAAEELNNRTVQMDFPDITGFTRSQPNHLPNPQHGYVIAYKSDQDLMVNVYVYNSGLERIPDGAASIAVKEEIRLAEVALAALTRKGMYRSYKERMSGEVRVGNWPKAPNAQRRLFEIDRVDTGRILTDVYITGYKDHFVKIRCSYPLEKQVESEKAVVPVLTALGKMMAS